MVREKLTVSWEDVNSPTVDAKLREQESKSREDAFTSPALSMNAQQLKEQQRPSIWYNTVFAMAFFGCLGGILAWGAGELIQLKPLTRAQYTQQLREAQDQWDAVLSVKRRYQAGIDPYLNVITAQTALLTNQQAVIEAALPLFFVAGLFQLSDGLQAAGIGALRGAADTRFAFVSNVIGYWIIGLPLSLLLGFRLHMGVVGLWWGFVAGLSCMAIMVFLRFRRLSSKEIAPA